jgi:hypothetical protein
VATRAVGDGMAGARGSHRKDHGMSGHIALRGCCNDAMPPRLS